MINTAFLSPANIAVISVISVVAVYLFHRLDSK